MGDHPAEGGRMVGGESGGGYFPSTGFDIPWNLLQQTPDTGYVGMDPPIDEDPVEGPPIDTYGSDDPYGPDDSGGFWDSILEGLGWGAGFLTGEELMRRTFKHFKPKPPEGGTPAPAPLEQPAPTPGPVGIKLPEFDPAYAKDAAAIGGAAGVTALLAKWFGTGSGSALASKVPSASGAMLFTPEMFGAPAGTTQRNIGAYFNQLRTGAHQISQGRVVQGFSTALIGQNTRPSSGSSRSSSRSSSTTSAVNPKVTTTNLGGAMLRHHLGLSTRTQRISKVDYS